MSSRTRQRTSSGRFANASSRTSTPLKPLIWPKKAKRTGSSVVGLSGPRDREGRGRGRDGHVVDACPRLARTATRLRGEQVLDHLDAFGGEAPRDVPLLEEAAGGDEAIDEIEMTLDEALAQHEVLRRVGREATVAGARGSAVAERAVVGLHHLPVVVTDAEVLVQRQHDRYRRVEPPHLPDHLEPQVEVVVEVHDVRAGDLERLAEVAPDARLVGLGEAEPIRHRRVEQDLALVPVAGERRTAVQQLVTIVTGEEHGLVPVRVVEREVEVVGGHLAAALRVLRMPVGDDQDALVVTHAGDSATRSRMSASHFPL